MDDINIPVEILLVEDTPTDAELCIRALRKGNLVNKLLWVKDGAEALDFLFCRGAYTDRRDKANPKVVLLDLQMPKVGGLEVLQRLRADERTKHIPVVVLTSSNEGFALTEAYNRGANSFITKPVEFDDFVEVVTKLGFYWLLMNKPPAD